MSIAGCLTVTQSAVKSNHASFDGNEQNSGVIEMNSDGFKITAKFKDRYNSLIAIYGNATLANGSKIFTPALTINSGITPNNDGTFEITKEGMAYMVEMSAMQKRGFKP
jgi:hypothetical protein